jgi:ketosteroid isomerase-like protein
MDNRGIVDSYYKLANLNDWSKWCDLFADDTVMDEQLAGHIEGLPKLREIMAGMKDAFPKFQNVPKHIVVGGDQAGVVSHLSVTNADGMDIECEVMNYFEFKNGKISYMANFHDTKPFDPKS